MPKAGAARALLPTAGIGDDGLEVIIELRGVQFAHLPHLVHNCAGWSAAGGRAGRFQDGPGVLAHIQDADDLYVGRQHSVTNERLLNHDTPQVRKNSRFDPVAPARVFSDGDARRPDLACDGHLNAAAKLAPEVTPNVSPVFPGEFRESDLQSSRGSVKKSGGQSSSLAPFASLNFFSRAGVAGVSAFSSGRRNRDDRKAAFALADNVFPIRRLRDEIVGENQAFAFIMFRDSDRLCHNGNLPQKQGACQTHSIAWWVSGPRRRLCTAQQERMQRTLKGKVQSPRSKARRGESKV